MQVLLHGARSSGPNKEVSDRVYQHRKLWGGYLQEQGYIPESGRTTYQNQFESDDPRYDVKLEGDSCICTGDDGLFADRKFDRVAGVLFIDKPGYGHFFPNFYSQKMNFRPLHRAVSRNIEVRSNKFKDLL
jgi:hypothetical protein